MVNKTIPVFPPYAQKPAHWTDAQWIDSLLLDIPFTSIEQHIQARRAIESEIAKAKRVAR